ncbi:MAG TPA: type I glyceraldehyde-3-phosphate dehydrogenase [Patescibacteria group bacterium]
MKRLKIGLNGFGRIGRAFTRIALTRNDFEIVVINTRKTPTSMMVYLLSFDSVYRRFGMEVKEESDGISVNGKKILTLLNDKPENIPWDKYDIDVVVDATGAFTKKIDLEKHLKGSVKKVVLTAPAKDDEIPFVVLGVNDDKFDFKKETVISMASCTTNCAAPMFKVINDNFKVISGFLTTAHAMTLSQSLLDDAGKKENLSRAAFINIIPSTTGAAKAVAKVIPELKEKIDGISLRVPVATGSITDISIIVEKSTTVDEINKKFKEASESTMKGIIGYEDRILVSSDFIGSSYSCIFDANYTKVVNGNLVKIFGWYDNEWGYSTRLVDLVERLAQYV